MVLYHIGGHRRRARVMLALGTIALFLPTVLPAQSVSPPIAEYQERARSSVQLSNGSIFPLTVVLDVNGEGMEFPGLTYGNPTLERLLIELGVIFTPKNLHNPNATPSGRKEYPLSARWTWGHDRVM